MKFFSMPRCTYQAADERDAEKENGNEKDVDDGEVDNDDDEEEDEHQARVQRVNFNLRTVEARNSEHGIRKIARKKGKCCKSYQFMQRKTSPPTSRHLSFLPSVYRRGP